jgi:hypothetical protein
MEKDIKEILQADMFKNDNSTESTKKIEKISKELVDHTKYSTHGKGISLEDACNMGLEVEDLSKDKTIEDLFLSIYHLVTITFETTDIEKLIINHERKIFAK